MQVYFLSNTVLLIKKKKKKWGHFNGHLKAETAQNRRSLPRGLLAHNLGGKSTTTRTQTNQILNTQRRRCSQKQQPSESLRRSLWLWSASFSISLSLHLSFTRSSPRLSQLKVLSKTLLLLQSNLLEKDFNLFGKKSTLKGGKLFVGQLVCLPRWGHGSSPVKGGLEFRAMDSLWSCGLTY